MSAKDAKNSFGMLLDYARAAPIQVEKHGRPVVIVMNVEEFQRLNESPRRPDNMTRRAVKVDL
jgi:prevent-host-death family protein